MGRRFGGEIGLARGGFEEAEELEPSAERERRLISLSGNATLDPVGLGLFDVDDEAHGPGLSVSTERNVRLCSGCSPQ